MSYNIGLNVIEVDGAGAPAIVGAATGVGAFNIITERGVPNAPVRVTSFGQFQDRFGSFIAGSYGAYMVKGFFDNGGQAAWVNRVAADAATPSAITLVDGGAVSTLRLQGGFRGMPDPGPWSSDIAVRVTASSSFTSRVLETAAATITGDALTATTDMSAFPALSVIVDGESSATAITFQASDFANPAAATPGEIRDAINRRQTKLKASLSGDSPPKLILQSLGVTAKLRRTFSSLRVTAANTALKLTAGAQPTFGTGADVTANGTRLDTVDGLEEGAALRLVNGANNTVVKVTRVDPTSRTVTWTPALGTPANFAGPNTTLSTVEFDIQVARGGTDAGSLVETWSGLSMEAGTSTYAPTVINNLTTGSRLLMATDVRTASPPAAGTVPRAMGWTSLTPGSAPTPGGTNFIGDAARHTGFSAFDPLDVQLMACERTDPAIVAAGLAYCQGRGDCLFVGSVPQAAVSGGTAIGYGQALQGAKVYGALYGPWIKVVDPVGQGDLPVKWVPPTGHVMGICARVASARGIWKAPAGDEARVLGALDVEVALSDADHTNLVTTGSVNGIRPVPGAGICVDASRTLSTDTRWLYVGVRLLFNYVKSSLRTGLRWVRQEPNRDALWSAVKHSSVTPFLMGLWRQGAFGTGKPEDVFTVICDENNNPPDQVDQGILKVEVYFYPSRPAETIVIIVGQQPSGATAAEA